MTPAPTLCQHPPGVPLAQMSRSLIAQEEQHFQATLAVMRQVRQLLADSAPAALAEAAQQAVGVVTGITDLRTQREQFRQTAARELRITPDKVTLRAVAERLAPADAAEVLQGRERLHHLAAEIADVNHGNAIIAWWCLDFAQQVFAALQGNRLGTRYGAAGKVQPAACGWTWQDQG